MPFEVIFQSDALVVIDVHSHLSTTEVIGLLGGTYCANERVLKVRQSGGQWFILVKKDNGTTCVSGFSSAAENALHFGQRVFQCWR